MSTIFVRLKKEYGSYLVLTSPSFSFVIKKGGVNPPAGFEVEKDVYEKFLGEYVEIVPKKPKRVGKVKELIKEEDEIKF